MTSISQLICSIKCQLIDKIFNYQLNENDRQAQVINYQLLMNEVQLLIKLNY